MRGVRIIVVMMVFALCLSGWTAQVQAVAHLSSGSSSTEAGFASVSDGAHCLQSAASEAEHDQRLLEVRAESAALDRAYDEICVRAGPEEADRQTTAEIEASDFRQFDIEAAMDQIAPQTLAGAAVKLAVARLTALDESRWEPDCHLESAIDELIRLGGIDPALGERPGFTARRGAARKA